MTQGSEVGTPSDGLDEGTDQLVARSVAGDTKALEQLLREHGTTVCSRLNIEDRWRRSFDADDILQVTALEAFLRIRALQTRSLVGFKAWLTRIAENNLRDAIRALSRQKREGNHDRITRGHDGESAQTLLASLAGTQISAAGIIARREDLDLLHRGLARLPASYRRVVQEVDLDERPVDAVAADMGRSPGSVYMLRSRAHDRLRELLASGDT